MLLPFKQAMTHRRKVLLETSKAHMFHHRVKKLVALMVQGFTGNEFLKDSQETWQLIGSHNL